MKRLILIVMLILPTMVLSARGVQVRHMDSNLMEEVEPKDSPKDSLCRLYGEEYGSLLAEDKIDLGMTKEMCMVVLDRECFIIRSKMDD